MSPPRTLPRTLGQLALALLNATLLLTPAVIVAALNAGLHDLRAPVGGGLREALHGALAKAAAALDTLPPTEDTP